MERSGKDLGGKEPVGKRPEWKVQGGKDRLVKSRGGKN